MKKAAYRSEELKELPAHGCPSCVFSFSHRRLLGEVVIVDVSWFLVATCAGGSLLFNKSSAGIPTCCPAFSSGDIPKSQRLET